MRLIRIGIALLLICGLTNAFAEPGNHRRDARDAVRAYHIQSVTLDRNLQRDQLQVPPSLERRRQDPGISDSSGYGQPVDGLASQQSDNMRRQGRMTPEERRALRRQIDEVGHDIYTPKH